MKKRLILVSLGAMAVLIGVATFAANTAQWVNVTAHLEKEIEVACVIEDEGGNWVLDPDGCDFGTVFPQQSFEKVVEVTLSESFWDQDAYSDVLYYVLWECKLVKPGELATAVGGGNPCRDDLEFPLPQVIGEMRLTDNIRDHIVVGADSLDCLSDYTGPPNGGLAKIKGLGNGVVDKDTGPKCFYHLAFTAPVCEGHFNPNTDNVTPKTVKCDENLQGDDIQLWERWADLGDDFKIQVASFSLD